MIPTWLFQILSVAGAILGAFIGVKLAVARLEVRVGNMEKRQDEHSERIVYLERAHKKV